MTLIQQTQRKVIALFVFAGLLGNGYHLCAQGTAFTYQGRLQSGTNFAYGSYDLAFSVWTASAGPSQVGGAVTNLATGVTNGLFAVVMDFGGVFDGNPRWLEIGVRTNGSGAFTTLSPRQPLTATPYAIFAGGVSAAGISGTIPPGNIASGTITSNMLAAGAAAANLTANGQSPVPSGAMVLSSNPNATNLTTAGYMRMGGQLDMAWQQSAASFSPVARGSHTAIWTGSKMIVWGGIGANLNALNSGAAYEPAANTWSAVTTNNAPSARAGHSAIWSGSEMIVWGGSTSGYGDDGARYSPANDSWSPMTASNAPAPRSGHTAVWTGSEMIVWGGNGVGDIQLKSGARYSPSTDSWTPISTNDAPAGRFLHTAVWTGSEMIIWGGLAGSYTIFNDGARYNPTTDTWSPITTNGSPTARAYQRAVWTGSEMIIWGGQYNWPSSSTFFSNGARFNPASNSWSAMTNVGSPSARSSATALWTGNEMIVWGGAGETTWSNTGGRYNPANDFWSVVPTSSAPAPRQGHTAVWTGSEMIVFGGYNNDATFGDTYAYAPLRVMYLYLRP